LEFQKSVRKFSPDLPPLVPNWFCPASVGVYREEARRPRRGRPVPTDVTAVYRGSIAMPGLHTEHCLARIMAR
jgi:hypothetical protein